MEQGSFKAMIKQPETQSARRKLYNYNQFFASFALPWLFTLRFRLFIRVK